MRSDLCFGIAAKNGVLAAFAQRAGCPAAEMNFPANAMGREAIRIILTDYDEPVRVAITGADAIALALAFQNGPQREICIVSSAAHSDPAALAQYARRRI
jgi:hypothetical protein